MLYALFMVDAILLGITLVLIIAAGIKFYKQVDYWFDNQQSLGQKELDLAFHNGHLAGAREENTRISQILKEEYNKFNKQDNQETIKTIIKINKLIKQEEDEE